MVRFYYDQTQDTEFLTEAVSVLDIEYNYWMTTHTVNLPDGSILNRYVSPYETPRPESYLEDTTNAYGMSPSEAKLFYRNIIAGAESGEDFSSRWFLSGGDLKSISTTSFIPVGLNSILYKFESNMNYFYNELGIKPNVDYAHAMANRRIAMDTYLWNAETFQWHDFCLTNNSQILRPYPANWFPIWAGAYDTSLKTQLFNSFMNSGLLQVGGILTSLQNSSQQWDSPNAWAPFQSILAEVMEELGSPASLLVAKTIAIRWVNATYIGYQNSQIMQEKYNAYVPGAPGSGGEYPTQIGFGWTNGVTLEFLNKYLTTPKKFV
jgi:alpha,alpha-trehalase